MQFDKLRQHDLDEKRRDEAENRERRKDAKKLKERKENDIPAAFKNEQDDQVRSLSQFYCVGYPKSRIFVVKVTAFSLQLQIPIFLH